MTLNHSKTWPVSTFAVIQLRVDPNSRAYSALADSGLVLNISEGPKDVENNQDFDNEKSEFQIPKITEISTNISFDKVDDGHILPLSKKHLELFSRMSSHNVMSAIRTDTISTTLEQEDFDSDHHLYPEKPPPASTFNYRNNFDNSNKLSSVTESTGVRAKIETIGRRPSNNVENWDLIYKENKANKFTKVLNENGGGNEFLNGLSGKIASEIKGGNCNKHNDCLLADFPLDARKAMTLRRHYYPEGGWGWIIIICSLLLHILNHGIQLSFSQLVAPAADKFKTAPLNVAGMS